MPSTAPLLHDPVCSTSRCSLSSQQYHAELQAFYERAAGGGGGGGSGGGGFVSDSNEERTPRLTSVHTLAPESPSGITPSGGAGAVVSAVGPSSTGMVGVAALPPTLPSAPPAKGSGGKGSRPGSPSPLEGAPHKISTASHVQHGRDRSRIRSAQLIGQIIHFVIVGACLSRVSNSAGVFILQR